MHIQKKVIIEQIKKILGERFNRKNPDFVYYLTIFLSFIIFVVGLNSFVELTDELAENELKPYDEWVTEMVLSFRGDRLTDFFMATTQLGDRNSYIAVSVLMVTFFFWKFKNWKFSIQVLLVLVLASLSNIALKEVFARPRPALEHLVEVSSMSYPSGHAMSAMAFYGFLMYLCLRMKMRKWVRILFSMILSSIILVIGISRIYLGVHYPSDVLAGFIGGLIWVTFCAILFNIIDLIRIRKSKRRQGL